MFSYVLCFSFFALKTIPGPQTREAPPVSPSPQTSAKVAATNERSNPITASAESNPVQCQLQPAYGVCHLSLGSSLAFHVAPKCNNCLV